MLNRKRPDRTPTNHDTSLIARGTIIRGDVSFSGALHLDGRIEGAVLAEENGAVFTLSENGMVQGEIRVPQAVINGHVHGDIHVAERLELAPEARVIGDVHYRTLEMAAGAQVNGRISHQATDVPRELPAPTLGDVEALPA
jgi:cytoskeletal protein CcmA (bactofilin family)